MSWTTIAWLERLAFTALAYVWLFKIFFLTPTSEIAQIPAAEWGVIATIMAFWFGGHVIDKFVSVDSTP